MRRIKTILITGIITLMIVGCTMPGLGLNSATTSAETSTLTQPLAPSETRLPAITETQPIPPMETAKPSATPFVPFSASVWADNVNVRTNPGYLFPAVRLLTKNSTLTILGKAPGGEWMFARTTDGTAGWVFTQLIQSAGDLQAVPVVEPKDVQLIKGKVVDMQGNPIQGVGFSILQGEGDQRPTNHVLTDSDGEFFSFMPLPASGGWTVFHDSIACKSNVWTDDSCSYYKDPYHGLVEPQSIVVSLPQTGVLEFTWK